MCKRLRRNSVQSHEIEMESDGEDETRATDEFLGFDDDVEEDDSDDADYNYGNDDVVEDDHDENDYVDASAVKDADDVVVVDNDEVESVDADDDVDVNADDERQYLDDRENPSFTLTLNPKKTRQLLIPARLIKDYDLHFPESITLVDPLVKKFGRMEKKMKIQRNGSVFVNGFGSVIRRNKVKPTDKMIVEIKKTGNNNLVQTIKIHIVSG